MPKKAVINCRKDAPTKWLLGTTRGHTIPTKAVELFIQCEPDMQGFVYLWHTDPIKELQKKYLVCSKNLSVKDAREWIYNVLEESIEENEPFLEYYNPSNFRSIFEPQLVTKHSYGPLDFHGVQKRKHMLKKSRSTTNPIFHSIMRQSDDESESENEFEPDIKISPPPPPAPAPSICYRKTKMTVTNIPGAYNSDSDPEFEYVKFETQPEQPLSPMSDFNIPYCYFNHDHLIPLAEPYLHGGIKKNNLMKNLIDLENSISTIQII